MKTIQKSVLLWHSAHEMFALVTDVHHYPQFLPWCDHSEVIERDDSGMVAKVGMSISGLRQSFTTRNRHVDDRQVLMELVDGPFSHLEGCWDFVPLGDGTQRACKVEFRLTYGFSSQALATLGRCYAAAIRSSAPAFDLLFGPAYKGIVLAAAVAVIVTVGKQEDDSDE